MKVLIFVFVIFAMPYVRAQNCSTERLLVHAKCEDPSKISNENIDVHFVDHVGIYSLLKQEQNTTGEIVCHYGPVYFHSESGKRDSANWRSTYVSKGVVYTNVYDHEALGGLFRSGEKKDVPDTLLTYQPFVEVTYAPSKQKWDYDLRSFFNGVEFLERDRKITKVDFTGIRKDFSTPPTGPESFYVTGANCKVELATTNVESLADL